MKSFFKFIAYSGFIALMVGGTWCYHQGLKADNYKTFFSDLIAEFNGNKSEETTSGQANPKKPKQRNSSKVGVKANNEQSLQPLPKKPFSALDKQARNCPAAFEKNIDSVCPFSQI